MVTSTRSGAVRNLASVNRAAAGDAAVGARAQRAGLPDHPVPERRQRCGGLTLDQPSPVDLAVESHRIGSLTPESTLRGPYVRQGGEKPAELKEYRRFDRSHEMLQSCEL
ncbi:hypothetical protein GCM10009780_15960 [Actinomadura alba]